MASLPTYDYTDPQGNVVYTKKRLPASKGRDKQFAWVQPDGKTGKGSKHPWYLFNLHKVVEAASEGRVVWVVEGEKDVLTLAKRGRTATTGPSGAASWDDRWAEWLVGCQYVIICYDNDSEGHSYALKVAASLQKRGVPLRWRRPQRGKDITDHLAAGGTLATLGKVAPPGFTQKANQNTVGATTASGTHISADPTGAHPLAEGHRNVGFTKLAGSLRRFGLIEGEIAAALRAINKALPGGGISDTELRGISKRIGDKPAPEDDFEARVEEAVLRLDIQDAAGRYRSSRDRLTTWDPPDRSFADWVSEEIRTIEWTVDGLWPRGSNVLFTGRRKTGKTRFLINLAYAIATDNPFLGLYECRAVAGTIGYMNFEMSDDQFRAWWQGIPFTDDAKQRIAPPLNLRGVDFQFSSRDDWNKVLAWAEQWQVEVLIVDPAARAWQGMVDNENDNVQVGSFLHQLDQLKRAAGIEDLILATHLGKDIVQDSESARGASRLEDWPDAIWVYTKDEDRSAGGDAATPRYFRAEGRDVDLYPPISVLTGRGYTLTSDGATRTEQHLQTTAELLTEELRRRGAPLRTQDLSEVHGVKKNVVREALVYLQNQGIIRRYYENGEDVPSTQSHHGGKTVLHELTQEARTRRIKKK